MPSLSVLCLLLGLFGLVHECRTHNAIVKRQGSKFLHIEQGKENSSGIYVCADEEVNGNIEVFIHSWDSSEENFASKLQSQSLPHTFNISNNTIITKLVNISICKLLVIMVYRPANQSLSDLAVELTFTRNNISYDHSEAFIVLNPIVNMDVTTTTAEEDQPTTPPQVDLGQAIEEFSKTQDYFVPVIIILLGILLVLVILGLLCQWRNQYRNKGSDPC